MSPDFRSSLLGCLDYGESSYLKVRHGVAPMGRQQMKREITFKPAGTPFGVTGFIIAATFRFTSLILWDNRRQRPEVWRHQLPLWATIFSSFWATMRRRITFPVFPQCFAPTASRTLGRIQRSPSIYQMWRECHLILCDGERCIPPRLHF